MNPGEEISCEYCGNHAFLVKKTVMDGWVKKEDILVCSACGETIQTIKDEKQEELVNQEKENTKLDKLVNFLKTEQEEKKTIDAEEKKFCRDCKNYIVHPFVNRCDLKDEEVNPMDDCKNFSKKSE